MSGPIGQEEKKLIHAASYQEDTGALVARTLNTELVAA